MHGRFGHGPQVASVSRSNDSYAWTGHTNQSTSYTHNGLNQIASIDGATTQHDARGNLTHDPTTGLSFGYWSENELVGASNGRGFGHDTFGRILDKLANGVVTEWFVHDGVQLAAAFNAGGIAQRYVWGDGPDELVAWYEGSGTGTRRWAHQDERNSLIAVSDASGAMVAINRYDEYGRPQSTNLGRFQYTGQMWLGEIGLYHYKNRNYAPHLGRFMQADPIGYAGGINLYAYVGNDPVNRIDPLGLQVEGIEFGGSLMQSRVLIGGSSYRGSIFYATYTCVRFCDNSQPYYDYEESEHVVPAPPQYGWVTNVSAPGINFGWSFGMVAGGMGEVAGGGEVSGGQPQPEQPSFCRSELYSMAEDLDQAAGAVQMLAIAGVGLGQAEFDPLQKFLLTRAAWSVYGWATAARYTATGLKWFAGDELSLGDLAGEFTVKTSGIDKWGQVAGGVGLDIAKSIARPDPCQ